MKLKTKIILQYALLGPPIGGVFALAVLTLLAGFLSAGDSLFAIFLAIIFSYPFGLIPAVVCGVYAANCFTKQRVFLPKLYYLLAAVFGPLARITVISAGGYIGDIYDVVGEILISSLAGLFSAFAMLHFTRKKLLQIANSQASTPRKEPA